MADTTLEMTDVNLKKGINLWILVMMMIGINVGGSLFVLTGVAAGLTGPSLVVAQLVSSLPILLALIPYFTISSAAPATCASYQYAKLLSRPMAAAAWMTLFIAIPLGALPLFAIATGNYIQMIIPGLPPVVTAFLVMTVFFLVNVLGIKPVGWIQLFTVLILIAALIVFIGPGLPLVEPDNFRPFFAGGTIGFLGASALLFTLLAGGLFGIELGGEVKEARATIPKALMISIVIVLGIYVLLEVAAVGVVRYEAFAEAQSLSIPAEFILRGTGLTFFIVGGGVLACVTTINLIMTIAGRYVLAFSYDGLFPRFFQNVNKRFGTPHWGLTLAYGLTMIMLVLNYLFQVPLIVLGQIMNFGMLFMITLVLMAVMRLPKKHPDIYARATRKYKPGVIFTTALLAIIINIVFMAILAYAMLTQDNTKWAFPLFIVAVAIGIIVYYARRKKVRNL